MFGSWLFLLTNCHQVTAGYQNSQYSGFKLICIEHEQTLLSLQNEYKNAVHMSSSADSHFAIEICVIFFLSIFFYFVNIFFFTWISGLRTKKSYRRQTKNPTKSLICFWRFFYRFIFCAFFSLTFFFVVVVHNFCVGITISIYFCINLILKVKLWCWMLLLLMSLHWLSFKTVSRNFFHSIGWDEMELHVIDGLWVVLDSCWYEVKIDK